MFLCCFATAGSRRRDNRWRWETGGSSAFISSSVPFPPAREGSFENKKPLAALTQRWWWRVCATSWLNSPLRRRKKKNAVRLLHGTRRTLSGAPVDTSRSVEAALSWSQTWVTRRTRSAVTAWRRAACKLSKVMSSLPDDASSLATGWHLRWKSRNVFLRLQEIKVFCTVLRIGEKGHLWGNKEQVFANNYLVSFEQVHQRGEITIKVLFFPTLIQNIYNIYIEYKTKKNLYIKGNISSNTLKEMTVHFSCTHFCKP